MIRDPATLLRTAYGHATMSCLAQHLKSAPEWKAVQDIKQRYDQVRERVETAYQETYDARVSAERQAILRRRGQNRLEVKTPFGVDRFNSTAIEQQAHRNVRNAHAQDMSQIEALKTKELKSLFERAGIKPETARQQSVQRAQTQGATPRLKQHF